MSIDSAQKRELIMKISVVRYVSLHRVCFALAVVLGSVAGGLTGQAQTVYTYYTGTSSAYLSAPHWTVGSATSTVFPGVTASTATGIVNGSSTDIADYGALAAGVYTSGIGINFNTSANNGVTSNAGAAGSLTLGAFDFTTALTAALSIGNSSTTATGTGTLTFTGQTLDGIANTIIANEGTQAASLIPSIATGTVKPAMAIGLNNATTNVIQVNGTGSINVSAVIQNGTGAGASNSLTINSAGTGAVVLSGTNTYSGATMVTAGTLLINGTNSGAGAVTVNAGTLGGSGTVTANTTVAAGASLAPGATNGTSTATLTLGTGTTGTTTINGTYRVDLGGAVAGTGYDQVSVLGALTLGSTSNLVISSITTQLTLGQKFYIALNDGADAVSGTFSQGTMVTDGEGNTYTVSYNDNGDGGTTGNDISLTVASITAANVPEPATAFGGLLLVGAAGWSQRRRFYRKSGLVA